MIVCMHSLSMKARFFCYAPKEKQLATDCLMVSFEEFEVHLPSNPPPLTHLHGRPKGTEQKSSVVVLYSYNCHSCLFLCTFLVNCKGVSGLSPFAEPSKLHMCSRRESILTEQTQALFLLHQPIPPFPPSSPSL